MSETGKKRVRATLLTLTRNTRDPQDLGTIGGPDNRYYYLPGADYNETVKALRDAGFKPADRIEDVVEDAVRAQSAEGEHDAES